MSQFLTTLKTRGRAVLIALALGATAVTAVPAPAMAQGAQFRFDFGITGGDSNFSFGIGKGGRRIIRDCLTNSEIRRGLRRSGWNDIRFIDSSGIRVRVIAEWDDDGRDYSMRINRCTGRVTDIERLRRRGGSGPGGGFGLHFEFN
jgi:hypothetical protein